jgi:hypothetical protein
MLFASTSPFPAAAGSAPAVAARPAGPVITRQADPGRFDRRSHASLCSGDANPSFVGVTGANNATAGAYSAVVGGDSNDACDSDDAVGGGTNNNIGNSGGAPSSFIGAGMSNLVNNSYAFVGAGESNNAAGTLSFVGAGIANSVTGNGSFLGSGGYFYIVNDGNTGATANSVSGIDSFLGSGDVNSVQGNDSFLGSGFQNSIEGGGDFVGSGAGNDATSSSGNGFIGSGAMNKVENDFTTIGGGEGNVSSGGYSSILGGDLNTAQADYSIVGGGVKNEALGNYGSVLGGYSNNAKGQYATVPGGYGNTAAGELSFAAGYHADATYPGSFVWSDYKGGSATLRDTAANEFLARASGGVYFYSNEAATSGVMLSPGSGAWASLSDRNAKTRIVPLDDESILAKVVALPVSEWSYKSEGGVRHYGPMAQDFYAAFGAGPDNRHITSIDEDGVALASIKALHGEIAELRAQNAALSERLGALAARDRR